MSIADFLSSLSTGSMLDKHAPYSFTPASTSAPATSNPTPPSSSSQVVPTTPAATPASMQQPAPSGAQPAPAPQGNAAPSSPQDRSLHFSLPADGNTPPPAATSGAGVDMSAATYDPNIARTMLAKYIQAGYNPQFASGMVANAMVESHLNPTAYNKNEGAFGLFQFRNDRLQNLRTYADRLGKQSNDLNAQIGFSIQEMQAGERVAYNHIMGGDPQSASDYAKLIDKYYERSSGATTDARGALASQIYSDFYGSTPKYDTVTGNVVKATQDQFGTPSKELSFGKTSGMPVPNLGTDMGTPAYQPTAADVNTGATINDAGNLVDANGNLIGGPQASQPPANGILQDHQRWGEKLLDQFYGTSNLSPADREERRRRMTAAFSAGLEGLTTRGERKTQLNDLYTGSTQREYMKSQTFLDTARAQMLQTGPQYLAYMAHGLGLDQYAPLAAGGQSGQKALGDIIQKTYEAKLAAGGPPGVQMSDTTRFSYSKAAQLAGMPGLAAVFNDPNSTYQQRQTAIGQLVKATGPTLGNMPGMDTRTALADAADRANMPGISAVLRDPNAPPQTVIDATKQAESSKAISYLTPQQQADQLYQAAQAAPETMQGVLKAMVPTVVGNQQLMSTFMQVARSQSPDAVKKFQYMLTLPADKQQEFLNTLSASAGGTGALSLLPISTQMAVAPIKMASDEFAKDSTMYTNMGMAARSQFLQAANPAVKPGIEKNYAANIVRVLAPFVPKAFLDKYANNEEMLMQKFSQGVANGQIGNLAAGMKGALSDTEGERLMSIMANVKDRRIEQLALTQYVQTYIHRQQLMQQLRVNYMHKVEQDPTAGFDQQGFNGAVQNMMEKTPVFPIYTQKQYYNATKNVNNDQLSLAKRGQVIGIRMPDGSVRYRTFGFYKGE